MNNMYSWIFSMYTHELYVYVRMNIVDVFELTI